MLRLDSWLAILDASFGFEQTACVDCRAAVVAEENWGVQSEFKGLKTTGTCSMYNTSA